MLCPDSTQRPCLKELIESLEGRKVEAEQHGWFGELEGIEISLSAARDKLVRIREQVFLGMPPFPSHDSEASG
jgi:hypothetical protein